MPEISPDEELSTDDAALKAIENVDFDCDLCKHINTDNVTCKAFPDGIPIMILSNQIAHIKPYRNDNGIRFEKP